MKRKYGPNKQLASVTARDSPAEAPPQVPTKGDYTRNARKLQACFDAGQALQELLARSKTKLDVTELKSCVAQALKTVDGTNWVDPDAKFYHIAIGMLKYSGLYESLIESCLCFVMEVQGAFYVPGAVPPSVKQALDDVLGKKGYRRYYKEGAKPKKLLSGFVVPRFKDASK